MFTLHCCQNGNDCVRSSFRDQKVLVKLPDDWAYHHHLSGNILRRILQLYPYKLQSCHELLPADTAQREAFMNWAFSKMEQDLTSGFLTSLWTDEAHLSLHGDVNNHNCRIWATSNPREYTQKPLHSPKVTAWCGSWVHLS
ncbi:uncharacterized protein TNCV_4328081 [Trichonephila clavipes]|nr:uncharacterized protein TNCV_4328081 [Trichonephila clavipes]